MLVRFLNTFASFSVQLVCEFDYLIRRNILGRRLTRPDVCCSMTYLWFTRSSQTVVIQLLFAIKTCFPPSKCCSWLQNTPCFPTTQNNWTRPTTRAACPPQSTSAQFQPVFSPLPSPSRHYTLIITAYFLSLEILFPLLSWLSGAVAEQDTGQSTKPNL